MRSLLCYVVCRGALPSGLFLRKCPRRESWYFGAGRGVGIPPPPGRVLGWVVLHSPEYDPWRLWRRGPEMIIFQIFNGKLAGSPSSGVQNRPPGGCACSGQAGGW